ncbi:MAG TPA: FliM/FliN family flagellar motor switch protein [Acidimicrobiales bacterium]|nr:FliM/FliN family flagellar motor switch protein [Acidimicrobiales bacterium]
MIPSPTDVSALLGTLFGSEVDATDALMSASPWALALFETPELGLVAAAAADVVLVATMGAAIAGYPVDTVETALEKGKVGGELWDNFAEVLNVMNGLFMDDGDHTRVVLHSVQRVEPGQWETLVGHDLPMSALRVAVPGYPAGQLALVDLGDRSLAELGLERRKTAPAPSEPTPAVSDTRWRPHDFRQPTGVSRGLLRSLHVHLGEVARTMASTLAGRLQAKVHQKVLQIRHVGRDELVAGVGNDVLVTSFRVDGMEGRFLLAWKLDLAMCLLDMLLGGTGVPCGPARRPTALDLSLLEPAVRQVLGVVPSVLQPFVPERDLTLGDSRIDLELTLPADAATDTWLATYLSADLAGTEHQAVLAIPMLALQPILERIVNGDKQRQLELEEGPQAFGHAVLGVPGDVHVHFPTVHVPAERIAGLATGDVLVLEGMLGAPLHLRCGQVHVANVEPVVHGTRLCVRVRDDADFGRVDPSALPTRQLVHSA